MQQKGWKLKSSNSWKSVGSSKGEHKKIKVLIQEIKYLTNRNSQKKKKKRQEKRSNEGEKIIKKQFNEIPNKQKEWILWLKAPTKYSSHGHTVSEYQR